MNLRSLKQEMIWLKSMGCNIVLFEPEIPTNTGNIMRTCVGTNSTLHLIKPYGFKLNDKYLKRSGLDYLDDLKYIEYENWEEFAKNNKGSKYFLTRYGLNQYNKIDYKIDEEIYLVFGKESTGIDKMILKDSINNTFRIPTSDKVRSLNLSNCVALVLYDCLAKLDFPGLSLYEPEKYKGKDFLINYKEEIK